MANVTLALRQTTHAGFTAVTKSAEVISLSAEGIGSLARAAAYKARQLQEEVEIAGEFSRDQRISEIRMDMQLRHASTASSHLKALSEDPALAKIYEQKNDHFNALEANLRTRLGTLPTT